jgi:mono/diheme cytochrome c family protein
LSYAVCTSCHGIDPTKGMNNIGKAKSATAILNAIKGNTGGMGFLSSTITSVEAANIAAYISKPF